jgi:hypothetical protein
VAADVGSSAGSVVASSLVKIDLLSDVMRANRSVRILPQLGRGRRRFAVPRGLGLCRLLQEKVRCGGPGSLSHGWQKAVTSLT